MVGERSEWAVWRDIKSMSSFTQRDSGRDRKPFKTEEVNEADLPNMFSALYSCFEKHDFSKNIPLSGNPSLLTSVVFFN